MLQLSILDVGIAEIDTCSINQMGPHRYTKVCHHQRWSPEVAAQAGQKGNQHGSPVHVSVQCFPQALKCDLKVKMFKVHLTEGFETTNLGEICRNPDLTMRHPTVSIARKTWFPSASPTFAGDTCTVLRVVLNAGGATLG